jgi:two-component system, NarL family, nitrate/nitrite response regulator NarL
LYRRAVVTALEDAPAIEVVGEAEDGAQALDLIAELVPAVAVVDIRMKEMHGPGVLEAVVSRGLPTRILLLSAYTDAQSVHSALSQGAAGYLSKGVDERELCEAVMAVANDATIVARDLQDATFAEIRRQGRRSRTVLSAREREILQLAAAGQTQGEIAARLYISSTTVKTYLSRAYEKLGVSDRAAAVAEALRAGQLK